MSSSGAEWLLQFLYDKGLRGETLKRMFAIGMRESGGRPGVDNAGTNRDGSVDYGLFQINGKAHGAAIQKKFGWSMEDLRDPEKNFQVMMWMSKNGQDLSAWGVANPDGSVTGWAKNIGGAQRQKFEAAMQSKYPLFDKLVAAKGLDIQAPGSLTTGVSGSGVAGLDKSSEGVASKFGANYAWLSANPQLKKWFDDFAKRYVASNGQISEATFAAEFNNLPFVKQHSQQWLADWQMEKANPEVYQQALQQDVETLRDQANQSGAQLTDAELVDLAKKKRRFEMNDAQVGDWLAAHLTIKNGRFAGAAGTAQDELSQWAKKNGITLSDSAVQSFVRDLSKGDKTLDDVKAELRKTYMSGAYPAWADKINAGMDIADLASPYLSTAQKFLENDAVGLDDPLVKRMMQGTDANGQPRVVPLYEAEAMVRKDPRWQYTDNAYATYAKFGNDLLKMWGLQ